MGGQREAGKEVHNMVQKVKVTLKGFGKESISHEQLVDWRAGLACSAKFWSGGVGKGAAVARSIPKKWTIFWEVPKSEFRHLAIANYGD